MKRSGIVCLFLLVSLLVTGVTPGYGQGKKKREKQRIERERKEKEAREKARKDSLEKLTPYDKLLGNYDKVSRGFISIYGVKRKVYLELPFSQMDVDMLLASTISEISDNYEGIVGSKQEPLLIQFSLVDSTVLLKKMNISYLTDAPDNNIAQALKLNNMGAIVKTFKAEAFGNDGKSVVIDVTDFFNSDMKELSPFGIFSVYASMGYKSTPSFKKDRSFIASFKSFDDNLIIKSQLSYENNYSNGTRTFAKEIPVTATVTRTIIRLSDRPARPRIADPRVGIFHSKRILMSEHLNRTEEVYYAHRFLLEPKDKAAYRAGELTEPVKPIVFYIDNAFPESWKPYIKQAVEDWQETFEKAGFKNAVIAKPFPVNDSTFDPDNIKFNCIRYAPVPVANAMGPSWVDPRSGEIINASVYVFHDIVKLLNNWMFIQTSPADASVRGTMLPERKKMEGLQYVIRHELGHCLGLRHNMGASSAIPVDSLRSPSFTQKYGTTYSIMDYARFNYVAQPGDLEKGVVISPPTFGVYDYYAIQWNYRYFDPAHVTAIDEKAILEAMVSEKSGDIRYRFGNEFLTSFDPRTQTEDLGDDAIKASTYGIRNLKYVLDNLNDWVKADDKDYSYREYILAQARGQYIRYLNHVLTNIGGIHVNEKYEGDNVEHYKVVTRKKQQEALQFILAQMEDNSWLEPESLLKNMTITGTPLVTLRNNMVSALLQLPARVQLGAVRSDEKDPYTPEDVLDDLYKAFWKPTMERKKLTAAQMQMQKAFVATVSRETKLSPTGNAGTGVDAISLKGALPVVQFGNDVQDMVSCSVDERIGVSENNIPVGGFGYMNVQFNLMPALEPVYFGLLKKIQSLLKTVATSTSDKETAQHYQLLLHQVIKILK
jgi:hypothetical protein